MAMLNNQRVHRLFEAQLKSATRDFSVTIEKKTENNPSLQLRDCKIVVIPVFGNSKTVTKTS
jgi:hypothetical protein